MSALPKSQPEFRFLVEAEECLFIFDEFPNGVDKKGKSPFNSGMRQFHGENSQLINQVSSEYLEKGTTRFEVIGRIIIPSDSNVLLSSCIDLILALNKSGDVSIMPVFESILTLK